MRAEPQAPVHATAAARLACAALGIYRRYLSPLLPRSCRFHPTCSAYALEAVRRHGAARGLALAAGRVLRCHPLHPGGVDPVPAARRAGELP